MNTAYFKGLKENPNSKNYQSARDSVTTYLKEVWDGGVGNIKNFDGGLENVIAQTRIASSYGLMQMLYSVAVERGYETNNDKSPEKLNEINIFFPFAMDFHMANLKKIVGNQEVQKSNWDNGFETVFMKLFNAWNSGKDNYEQNIGEFSKEFLPQK